LGLRTVELGPAVEAGDLGKNHKKPEQDQSHKGQKNGQQEEREVHYEGRNNGHDRNQKSGYIEIIAAQESLGSFRKVFLFAFFGHYLRHDIQARYAEGILQPVIHTVGADGQRHNHEHL